MIHDRRLLITHVIDPGPQVAWQLFIIERHAARMAMKYPNCKTDIDQTARSPCKGIEEAAGNKKSLSQTAELNRWFESYLFAGG